MIPAGEDAGSSGNAVLLLAECRPLRRSLRPAVWVVLEEVALDAVVEDGRLVARTSARQVAERLGINPSTAASALAVLRERGLVAISRERGSGGRFGLLIYQLHPVAGLAVVRPGTAGPLMQSPSTVQPDTASAGVASPCMDLPHIESSRLEEVAPARRGRHVVGADLRPHSSDVIHEEGPPWRARALGGLVRPARLLAAMPRTGDVRTRVGVVVTALAVASPKGWQVSVPVWLVGVGGWTGAGVMAVLVVDGVGFGC